jgi:hypothetical protein
MDAIGCFESDRVVKLMTSTLKAAAQSRNEPYRAAALLWLERIRKQVARDRQSIMNGRAKRIGQRKSGASKS